VIRMFLVYAFVGVVCLGIAPLFGKMALDTVSPTTVFVLRTSIAAILCSTWYIGSRGFHEFTQVPFTVWCIITIEAILAAFLGDLAYFYALDSGNVNKVTLLMACTPLITVMLSFFVFHECLSIQQFLGALFITVGIGLITFR
jgi:bacterial/archaeal transporter family protein